MTREVSLGLQSDKQPGNYRPIAELAERLGFDTVSVFSDLMFQSPLLPAMEIAQATRRIKFGVACWNPYTVHPYEIAGQIAALDMVSHGRAYLGLARGAWLDEIGVEQPKPIAHLRESAELIYRLLRGDDSGFQGEVFSLSPGTALRYRPFRPDPPLLVGAWGPRAAALAGERASEIKVGGTANPAMMRTIRQRLLPGEMAAGRTAGETGIVAGAVTVVDRDAAAARRRARTEVAMYLPVVAGLDTTVDIPADLLDRLGALAAESRFDEAGRLIPDDLLDRFCFSGSPEQVAAQAQRLFEAGAARVEFGPPQGLTEMTGVELLGTAVLPALELGRQPVG